MAMRNLMNGAQATWLATEKALCHPDAQPETILFTDGVMVYRFTDPDYDHTYCEGVVYPNGTRCALCEDIAEVLGWRE